METKLAIFDTYKTKTSILTGEATRQRGILRVLATQNNPTDRTRTAISKQISRDDISWKNIYSGVFRDIDTVLVPLGVIVEEGRLPLTRGPRALQEAGIPYYRLTQRGKLISLALPDAADREAVLGEILSDGAASRKSAGRVLLSLARFAPQFTHLLIEKYVKRYCEGAIPELLPITLQTLGAAAGDEITAQREFLLGFMKESEEQQSAVIKFLLDITEYQESEEEQTDQL